MLRIRITGIEISRRLIVLLSAFRLGLILVLFASKLAYVEDLLVTIVSEERREAGREGQTLTWGIESSENWIDQDWTGAVAGMKC